MVSFRQSTPLHNSLHTYPACFVLWVFPLLSCISSIRPFHFGQKLVVNLGSTQGADYVCFQPAFDRTDVPHMGGGGMQSMFVTLISYMVPCSSVFVCQPALKHHVHPNANPSTPQPETPTPIPLRSQFQPMISECKNKNSCQKPIEPLPCEVMIR